MNLRISVYFHQISTRIRRDIFRMSIIVFIFIRVFIKTHDLKFAVELQILKYLCNEKSNSVFMTPFGTS